MAYEDDRAVEIVNQGDVESVIHSSGCFEFQIYLFFTTFAKARPKRQNKWNSKS